MKNQSFITRLSNGIPVILTKMEHVEFIAVNVSLKVGSRFETEKQSGISHFVEHMAFKGTKTRTAKQIVEEADNIGGCFNACTSRDYTSYYMSALKEDVSVVVDIISDIILNSIFPKDEIERERGVILQEIGNTNDTPDDVVFDRHFETCYPNQSFGRPVLGTQDTVYSFSDKDFINYIKTHYTTHNTVISIAGNFQNYEDICNMLEDKFCNMNNIQSNFQLTSAKYVPGFYLENRQLEQAQVVISLPSVDNGFVNGKIDKYIATNMYAMIVGGGMSSRLFQTIREKLGLAYAIYSYQSSYFDTGVFVVYAGVAPENVVTAIDNIFLEIPCKNKISESEIKRTKKQYSVSLRMIQENPMSMAKYNAKSFMNYGVVHDVDDILKIVNNVNNDDINSISKEMFNSISQSSFAIIGNVKENVKKTIFEKINVN